MSKDSKVSRQVQLQKILTGIAKYLASVNPITLGKTAYAPVDLEKLIQAQLDLMSATAKAKSAYEAAVALERQGRTKLSPVLRLLKNFVLSLVGDSQDSSNELGDFGFTPRKRRVLTVAEKSAAEAKSKATREARGTKGPRQKAEVKGTVPETKPEPQGTTPPAKA